VTMRGAMLGVHLMTPDGPTVRVGTLTRDAAGATAFIVDEAYLRLSDRERPILSLTWVNPESDADTRTRLAARGDKIALHGFLPPWFSNLLPEGALRLLVEIEMGQGDHDQFDVLTRLGADLPGAVIVVPEAGREPDAIRWETLHGFRVPVPEGRVKFSLAGVQLKFSAEARGERLSAPARSGEGRTILKMPSEAHRNLPEAEYTAMRLCAAVGLDVAPCRLVPIDLIDGIPAEFLAHGEHALAVERFDRAEAGGRIHVEDMAQVLGAGEMQKYTKGNGETVLNCLARFSTDWRADVMEGMRRIVADVLIGNGDNHLKNWSFRFSQATSPRLSPAYDIVPTWLYDGNDTLGLPFAGVKRAPDISFDRFRRVAAYLRLDPDATVRTLRAFAEHCQDAWPALIRDLPLPRDAADRLMARMRATRLAAPDRS
jgi:serine/threonine-protein kinase HipA